MCHENVKEDFVSCYFLCLFTFSKHFLLLLQLLHHNRPQPHIDYVYLCRSVKLMKMNKIKFNTKSTQRLNIVLPSLITQQLQKDESTILSESNLARQYALIVSCSQCPFLLWFSNSSTSSLAGTSVVVTNFLSRTPRTRPNIKLPIVDHTGKMPPMTGSDVNRNIPMPNAQYKQPEIDGNSQAIPSDTAEDLPSSSRDSTYPPAIVSELSMPNPQLLQLQLISPRLEWNRKLDLNRRNILEEMIERFDRVCYDSMPNPDHARLAKMFAIILFNGTP